MCLKQSELVLNNEWPVVVVVSGSMEPSIYRGDLLFVSNLRQPQISDIVVYNNGLSEHPIVHRIISI